MRKLLKISYMVNIYFSGTHVSKLFLFFYRVSPKDSISVFKNDASENGTQATARNEFGAHPGGHIDFVYCLSICQIGMYLIF